jgi:uncharacterized protein YdhG (YjbR/CyaY superfamily)
MMKPPAASIDDYLSKLPLDQRTALETLRGQIRAVVPQAQETISYGLPTFKLSGNLVHFGAAAKHCAFYPGAVIEAFSERLAGFETARGTIRFQPDNPPPPELIRDIVAFRVAQNEAIAAERPARKKR